MGKASRAKRGGQAYAWESQQQKQRRKEKIERHNQTVAANSAKATPQAGPMDGADECESRHGVAMFTMQSAPGMVIAALKADAVNSLDNVGMMCSLKGVSIHKLIITTVNPNGTVQDYSPLTAAMLLPAPKCFEWLLDDLVAKAETSKANQDALGDAWITILAPMELMDVGSTELRMSCAIHRRYLQLIASRKDLAALATKLDFRQTCGPRATEVLDALIAEIEAGKQKAELESAVRLSSSSQANAVKSVKASLRV